MAQKQRAFETFLRKIHPFLLLHHGDAVTKEIEFATREEYELILPRVPDIGGLKNVFQPVMIVNGWIIALHRAMSARGLKAICRVAPASYPAEALARSGLGDCHHPAPPLMRLVVMDPRFELRSVVSGAGSHEEDPGTAPM